MILSNGTKLKVDDKVVFKWFHTKSFEIGIIVHVTDSTVSVVFSRGWSSESETLELKDIYGIVDESRSVPRISIPGFSGHFILLKGLDE